MGARRCVAGDALVAMSKKFSNSIVAVRIPRATTLRLLGQFMMEP